MPVAAVPIDGELEIEIGAQVTIDVALARGDGPFAGMVADRAQMVAVQARRGKLGRRPLDGNARFRLVRERFRVRSGTSTLPLGSSSSARSA